MGAHTRCARLHVSQQVDRRRPQRDAGNPPACNRSPQRARTDAASQSARGLYLRRKRPHGAQVRLRPVEAGAVGRPRGAGQRHSHHRRREKLARGQAPGGRQRRPPRGRARSCRHTGRGSTHDACAAPPALTACTQRRSGCSRLLESVQSGCPDTQVLNRVARLARTERACGERQRAYHGCVSAPHLRPHSVPKRSGASVGCRSESSERLRSRSISKAACQRLLPGCSGRLVCSFSSSGSAKRWRRTPKHRDVLPAASSEGLGIMVSGLTCSREYKQRNIGRLADPRGRGLKRLEYEAGVAPWRLDRREGVLADAALHDDQVSALPARDVVTAAAPSSSLGPDAAAQQQPTPVEQRVRPSSVAPPSLESSCTS